MIHCFAGSNSAQGFCSRFGSILPERDRKRMIFLKGGPGVGKSTLMKRVGAAYEASGERVEYFPCASDPDSLDGIAVPELGFGMMDGTAPHVYDPVLPGARDELLDLAAGLDKAMLRRRLPEIDRLSREIGVRFKRATGFLSAAASVRDAACRALPAPKAERALVAELTEQLLPLRGGYGESRELFAEAYTPKGFTSLLDTLPQAKAVVLEVPFGMSADAPLRALAGAARARGLYPLLLLDPLRPEQARHLAIPEHGVLVSTAGQPTIPAERWCEPPEGAEREQGFDKNAFELLTLRATEQLKQAKLLHDELESYYSAAMDFARWEEFSRELCSCPLPSPADG